METLRKLKNLQFLLSGKLLFSWIKPTYINNDPATLATDENVLVCYVLRFRSAADLLVTTEACHLGGLPLPVDPISDIDESRSVFFLGRPEGTLGRKTQRRQSSRMIRLFEHQEELNSSDDWYGSESDDVRIKIVPVSVFWGHQPDREKSIFKLLLSENWAATSGFKKILAMTFHPNHILVQFGQPIDLAALMATESERPRQIRKLLRLLRVHFNKERQAIIGPDLSHRRTLIDTILASPDVRKAINAETGNDNDNDNDISKSEKKALGYAREIVSDQSYRVVRFFDTLLTWLWNRLYNGIELNGIRQAKDLAQSHEIVYIPCHRSHIDYLLLSYVLYHNGLTPPHIAAGRNLNLPVIGPLLRRAGAFYMRRSFQGDTLYKEIFDEYLHQMFTRGFSIEYFIEGGRSRTGRTLPPRTGMLSMTVKSFQKDSTKPIALLPVYFGYERVLESSTYRAELSGSRKRSESLFDVFKIFSSFKHDFGQVTVNFGEPVLLKEFLDEELNGWTDTAQVSTSDLAKSCNDLAQQLATNINNSVAIKATNLVALALLSTDRQSIDEEHLTKQVQLLRQIAAGCGYPGFSLAEASVEEIIDEATNIIGLSRTEHQFGTIVSASPDQAVSMTYNANNVLHVYALPSLLSRLVRTNKQAERRELLDFVSDLYPFLKAEMFLPWSQAELGAITEQILDCLVQLNIISARDRQLDAPPPASFEYNCLKDLSSITDPTLERFYIVIALLEYFPGMSQGELENAASGIAAQLSALYGINSPDFFEKSLFSTFLNTLNDCESATVSTLEPSVARTLDPDVRHNILQAVKHVGGQAR
ncbi:MAG: glycerol-3-phosphate 1-O-acyltransferase PlsB [Gammaproteobacteria bacterium]|jgi:glycerol-3-phosphate O-acyltransferase|nr:glycerol-3-phosphate 1-O-acyltransferase PlsB [Gammaproteobacteria bacterium]MBT7371814.1 glycerol-3-phosphate 1-O-acyltransferase PlsB [Gammaproteobacteria bacterium]